MTFSDLKLCIGLHESYIVFPYTICFIKFVLWFTVICVRHKISKDGSYEQEKMGLKRGTIKSDNKKSGGILFLGGLGIGLLFTLCVLVEVSWGCNEAVCASIVSKCTLTQACKCELKNCSCCRECFDCLTYLYDECCSCVGKLYLYIFNLYINLIIKAHVKIFQSKSVSEQYLISCILRWD